MYRNYRIAQFGRLFSEGVEVEPELTYQEHLSRRKSALDEDFAVSVLRCMTDLTHLATPGRIASLPATLAALARPEASLPSGPPDARFMRPAGNGFVSAAIDLTPAGILDGVGRGLILRWVAGRATWWAPAHRIAGDPRLAREPADALALLASADIRITLDRNFETVAARCARRSILRGKPFQPNHAGLAALARLFDAGFAHSVEIGNGQGKVLAGCYGIATGRVFLNLSRFGESASLEELAMVVLNRHLSHLGYTYHDMGADWSGLSFGFSPQNRDEAQACLLGSLAGDRRGRWLATPALLTS